MIVVLVVDGGASEVWEVTSTAKPPRPFNEFTTDWEACRDALQSRAYDTDEIIEAVRARDWQLTGQEFMDVED